MSPDTDASPSPKDEGALTRLVHTLTILRLLLVVVSFGMSVATAVLMVLGLGRLMSGDVRTLLGLGGFAIPAALAVVASRVAVPRIDRRLLREARAATGPDACLPLMELLTGIPVALSVAPLAVELARLLGTADSEWWQRNERDLRKQVAHALEAERTPAVHGFVRPPADGWMPALFDAIARCGRTEFLGLIEKVERSAGKSGVSSAVVEAARRCCEDLRRQKELARMAATLLRPAAPPGAETLLRPASVDSESDPAALLRPSSGPGTPADSGIRPSHEGATQAEQALRPLP